MFRRPQDNGSAAHVVLIGINVSSQCVSQSIRRRFAAARVGGANHSFIRGRFVKQKPTLRTLRYRSTLSVELLTDRDSLHGVFPPTIRIRDESVVAPYLLDIFTVSISCPELQSEVCFVHPEPPIVGTGPRRTGNRDALSRYSSFS